MAIISKQDNSEEKLLVPRYFVNPQTPYNPTDINPGEIGVSFPPSNKPYVIIYPITSAAIVKSIRLPITTNVDQMQVMFLNAEDKPILDTSSNMAPLRLTSSVERNPTIHVNLPSKVNAVHITLLHTTDNQPPKDVTVEIVICAEPKVTAPQSSVATSKTSVTSFTNHTSPAPYETSTTNYIPSIPRKNI